jgi:hypothetical protein
MYQQSSTYQSIYLSLVYWWICSTLLFCVIFLVIPMHKNQDMIDFLISLFRLAWGDYLLTRKKKWKTASRITNFILHVCMTKWLGTCDWRSVLDKTIWWPIDWNGSTLITVVGLFSQKIVLLGATGMKAFGVFSVNKTKLSNTYSFSVSSLDLYGRSSK